MADFTVSVTKNGLIPAVIYGGNENTYGQTIMFQFSSDWDGLTKEIIFFSMRGDTVVMWVANPAIVTIPAEICEYGGDSKYTIRGFSIDGQGYINDQLQVTGTLHYTYSADSNTRLKGKLTPNTLDYFLATAEQYIANQLQAAKDSGMFDGADGQDGQDGADGTPAGFGTPTATAHSLSQDAQPTVSVTASGEDTAKVFSFNFGIPVSVGKNFTILGHYSSIAALRAAVFDPDVGDAYSVGTETPYNIYIYDGPSGAWANYGPIGSGSVVVDESISSDSENAVQNKAIKAYVDQAVSGVEAEIPEIPSSLKNPYAVSIYGQSYDGSSAVTVAADDAMSSTSTKPAQNKVVKQYIDDALGDIQTALNAISAVIGDVSANNTSNEITEEEAE